MGNSCLCVLALIGTCFLACDCKTLQDFERALDHNLYQITADQGRIPPLKQTVAGDIFRLGNCAVYFDGVGCSHHTTATTLACTANVWTYFGCLYFIDAANGTELSWGEIQSVATAYLPIEYSFDIATSTIKAKNNHGNYTEIEFDFIACGGFCDAFKDAAIHHLYDHNIDYAVQRVLEKTVRDFNPPPPREKRDREARMKQYTRSRKMGRTSVV